MEDFAFSDHFFRFLDQLVSIVKDKRTKARLREMAVAVIAAANPKTLTKVIEYNKDYGDLDLNHEDWTSTYRALSEGQWSLNDLSYALLDMALEFVEDADVLMVAVDDTLLRKTGRCIPGCSYARDPLSPPFQTNLIWGERTLCVSVIICASSLSSYRAIPLFFQATPSVKIPSKASKAERATAKEAKKKSRMSVVGRELVNEIRRRLDSIGLEKKKLVVCGDGSFANRAFMENPPHDTAIICRCRNDLRLFESLPLAERTGKRLYGKRLQTPAELYADPTVPTKRMECGVDHQHASIDYKVMENVRWTTALKNQPCTVAVIKGQHYYKYGRRQTTKPAFLVMTGDVTALKRGGIALQTMIKAYLLRWEIEVGFRDQKNGLGIGKAQVWNETSVKRTPAFMSACYSILLMASMKAFGDRRTDAFRKLPKWRRIAPKRPSIRDLVDLLRREIQARRKTVA